jgi:colanic acid/amylovoran biosynthesis glycosyltransferase
MSIFGHPNLVSSGCRPEKMLVHHSGVDCDKINYLTKQRTPGELTHIITVARLVEKKGVEYSLRAVAKVITAGRQLTYTIVGDGPLRSYLERLTTDLGISVHVFFSVQRVMQMCCSIWLIRIF